MRVGSRDMGGGHEIVVGRGRRLKVGRDRENGRTRMVDN